MKQTVMVGKQAGNIPNKTRGLSRILQEGSELGPLPLVLPEEEAERNLLFM